MSLSKRSDGYREAEIQCEEDKPLSSLCAWHVIGLNQSTCVSSNAELSGRLKVNKTFTLWNKECRGSVLCLIIQRSLTTSVQKSTRPTRCTALPFTVGGDGPSALLRITLYSYGCYIELLNESVVLQHWIRSAALKMKILLHWWQYIH